MLRLWFDANATELAGKRLLHFAPEDAVAGIVRSSVAQYDTADIDPALGDMVLDIERIDLPDAAYDVILCFHVLEHVDDRKALGELYRILPSSGLLLLMVPIVEGWSETYENPSVSTERDRELHFGQSDHVRYYGADFRDRVREAGFALSEYTSVEPHVLRHGLLRGEKLFIARKP